MSDQNQPSFFNFLPEQRSPDHREMYSNASRVGMTPWDLTLVFGHLNDALPGQAASVTTELTVRMSPQQFKVFSNTLPVVMAEWESQFGQVTVPGHLTAENLRDFVKATQERALAAAAEAAKPATQPQNRTRKKV